MRARRSIPGFLGSMRGAMRLLVFVAIGPLLAVQAGIYSAWYYTRFAGEEQASREQARAVAFAFQDYVRDVLQQESAIGAALAGLGPDFAQRANNFLSATASAFPSIRSWHWVSPEGKILASSAPDSVGASLADRPYFKEMLAGREWAVSDLLEDGGSGQPAFVIAQRIRATQGPLRGAVLAIVNIGKLGERAVPLQGEEEGSITLFDRQGALVFSTADPQPGHTNWRDADPLLAAVLSDQVEQSGTVVAPSDHRKHIVARVPIAEIGWVAGAGLPVQVAMAEVYRGLWIVAGLNLVVVAASGFVVARTSRGVLRQLRRLQAQAQAVGRGEQAQETALGGVRELAELASSFHQMGARLRQAHEDTEKANVELERRVQERTADLAKAIQSLQTEVNDRQRAEQSLREQSRVLDAFFKHTFTCLVILDQRFNFIRVNEAYANACGRDVSEFAGHNHFEFYPAADNEAIFREVVRSKSPYQAAAKPFVFPDHPEWGTTYWDWTLVPILDAAGEVEFLVFSLNDVTQRKEAERRDDFTRHLLELFAKKESRKEYRDAVVKAIRDWSGCRCVGIRVLDERQNVPYVSYVGFSREFWERENEISLDRDCCACVRVILQTPEPQDMPCMTPGGSFRCQDAGHFVGDLSSDLQARYRGECVRTGFNSIAVIPILYRKQPLGVIHLADEREGMVPLPCVEFIESMAPLIGEAIHRFNVEKELGVHRRHLEELVAERTEELRISNEQLQREIAERKQAAEILRRTAEDLARSNQELEQFAYVASHDLQEPLRIVTGYIQLLQRRLKQQLDADGEQFMHYVVDGVARMQQLIVDLLNYSRVGTRGKLLEPTEVEAAFHRVLANLQRVIGESGAVVTHDPLPRVKADETQLVQLFQNLIGNAIKFRSERRPEIHVSARREGTGWLFSVRDNGIGIEEQYWPRVFEIFQRLHTRQKYPGTGIGLAICKRIVERHGGRIWLDSTPGQDTTFYFTMG